MLCIRIRREARYRDWLGCGRVRSSVSEDFVCFFFFSLVFFGFEGILCGDARSKEFALSIFRSFFSRVCVYKTKWWIERKTFYIIKFYRLNCARTGTPDPSIQYIIGNSMGLVVVKVEMARNYFRCAAWMFVYACWFFPRLAFIQR